MLSNTTPTKTIRSTTSCSLSTEDNKYYYGSIEDDEISDITGSSSSSSVVVPSFSNSFMYILIVAIVTVLVSYSGLVVVGDDNTIPNNDGAHDKLSAPNDVVVPMLRESSAKDYDNNDEDTSRPLFFDQITDHSGETDLTKVTWKQRYYCQKKYFRGPGSPIFLVVGGEAPNTRGLFDTFIYEEMARKFGAFVIHPEHRFYGVSQPLGPHPSQIRDFDLLSKLLTPQQAMVDMLEITTYYQKDVFGCSSDKQSKDYCPIITAGGSYPGFLAAMMRLLYPDIVDMAYASSAPLKLWSHETNSQFDYYDIVTKSAERASKGCSNAVKSALTEVDDAINNDNFMDIAYNKLNICGNTIPYYIGRDGADQFSRDIMQIIGETFADMNMFNYPPTSKTRLAQVCIKIFQNDDLDSYEKVSMFWKEVETWDSSIPCYNMSATLPDGPNSRITGSDWSGIGPNYEGMMFDFQCCTTISPIIGYGPNSMFPYRKETMDWLNEHCYKRFKVSPRPYELVNEWKFNNLVEQNASHILFANGLNDMWSAGSYLHNLSDSILAVNMPNGAHHSELYHSAKFGDDTEDVKQGKKQIQNILEKWLNEVR